MKLLANLDLNKNQLQNAVAHPLSSAPSSPSAGQFYFNTGDGHLYFYTGSGWFDVTNALTLGGDAAALFAKLASPTFTGTPVAPTASAGTNTTQLATCAFVIAEILARIASLDVMQYKGAIDASSNPNYPAANSGDTYRISVAGKIGGGSGPNVEAGDLIICHADSSSAGNHATVGSNWDIVQINIDGAVTINGSQTLTNKTISGSNNTLENIPGGEVVINSGSMEIINTNDAQSAFEDLDLYLEGLNGTQVEYNNATSGLTATNVQDAIDELETMVGGGPGVSSYKANIGNGSDVDIVVNHALSTRDVIVQLYRNGSPYDIVICDVEMTDANNVTLRFAVAPTTNQYRVIIIAT